jgi:enamine deaminase RidA (YjgF/YER057c/UK114 family)
MGEVLPNGKSRRRCQQSRYTKFFDTAAQPNLPSRSVVQVAGLAHPGLLVEIEVTAVKT